VFLLLIFFMVAGQIKAMPNADLILPKALLNEEDAHSEMRLEVAQQGTLTLDGTPCTPEELVTRLQALSDHAAISVGIFADQRATSASLEQAMAVLRQYS
ncbi:biopolymer transporter ExbD, partial [Wenyingzhuangia sp. 1_MG-2023]|nr:biopolymer transporter ExbD [Wenyingzhuangia sp. 1_MG-2023]